MSLLLDLPEEVSSRIVGDWLCMRHFGKLDVAFCNHRIRTSFNQLLSITTIENDAIVTKYNCRKYLEWIVCKGIKLREIFIHALHASDSIDVILRCITISNNTITKLRYVGCLERRSNSAWANSIMRLCHNLTSLFLESVAFPSRSLHAMASNNSTLRKIELNNCTNINDTACLAILNNCPLLYYIDLRLTDITDAGIIYLAKLPQLTEVELFGCRCLTDIGIIELITHCGSRLLHLSISKTRATEKSVLTISQNCPLLKSLNLERIRITQPAYATNIGNGCRMLENLSLVGCGAITGNNLFIYYTVSYVYIATFCYKLFYMYIVNICI